MRLPTVREVVPHVAIGAVVAALYVFGALDFLEYRLADLRYRLTPRAATSELVIVAIDAESVAEVGTWPWPRSLHARAVERLYAAGARQIALDIDFSSRSTPGEDAALAGALKRVKPPPIVPVFKQYSRSIRGLSSIIETGPIDEVADSARLASINVRPESDGLVRRLHYGDMWRGRYVPSMAAALITPGRFLEGSFYIDFGIDVASIPVISFADLLAGRFDERRIRGKTVVIGSTAIELGDQIAVPIHKALPGVLVEGLAFETIVQGRALKRSGLAPITIITLLMAVLLGPWLVSADWRSGALATAAAVLGTPLLALAVQSQYPVLIDTSPLMLVAVFSYGSGLVGKINVQARQIFKQDMAALHRQATMRTLLDQSFDGFLSIDANGRVQWINSAGAGIFGSTEKDMIGQDAGALFGDGQFENAAVEFLETQLVLGAVAQPREVTGRRVDKTTFAMELAVARSALTLSRHPLERRTNARVFYLCTVRDIGDRKKAEMELRQAQKMEAVGQLTGGAAHEFNNLLMVVAGNLDLMRRADKGEFTALIERAQRAVSRGASLTRHLLAFSRKQPLQPSNIDLNELILSVKELLSGTITGEITINTSCTDELWQIHVDPIQIELALLNIAINARDAMPDGGSIDVTAWNTTLASERQVSGSKLRPGDYVVIAVSDTGGGMPPEVIERAFEPFFTTKELGKGTGLGLSMVYGFVEQSGGAVEIESNLGQGSVIRIFLPKAELIDEFDELSDLANTADTDHERHNN